MFSSSSSDVVIGALWFAPAVGAVTAAMATSASSAARRRALVRCGLWLLGVMVRLLFRC